MEKARITQIIMIWNNFCHAFFTTYSSVLAMLMPFRSSTLRKLFKTSTTRNSYIIFFYAGVVGRRNNEQTNS